MRRLSLVDRDLGVVIPIVNALVPTAFQAHVVAIGFGGLFIGQPSRHHGARLPVAVNVGQDHLAAGHGSRGYWLPRA